MPHVEFMALSPETHIPKKSKNQQQQQHHRRAASPLAAYYCPQCIAAYILTSCEHMYPHVPRPPLVAHHTRRHGARFPHHAVCQMHLPASPARIIISKSDSYCTHMVAIWHFWDPSPPNAVVGRLSGWGWCPLNCVTVHKCTHVL